MSAPWQWRETIERDDKSAWLYDGVLRVHTRDSRFANKMSTMIGLARANYTHFLRNKSGEEPWRDRAAVEAFIKDTIERFGLETLFRWGKPIHDNEEVEELEEQYDLISGTMVKVAPITGRARVRSEGSMARGCDNCTLKNNWVKLRNPCIPTETQPDADILIIGEAPGEIEDQGNQPFIGPAGKKLRPVIFRHRDRVALTNMTRCRPPGNRNPTPHELHACSQYLEDDIIEGNYKAILGLGGTPLSKFFGPSVGITQVHGLKFPVEIAGKTLWYYPTVHPAFILHTANQSGRRDGDDPVTPIFINDIKNFFHPEFGVDTWERPVIKSPTPDDVKMAFSEEAARGWCARLKRDKPLGLDIETNDLRPNATGAAIMTAAVSDGETTVAWPVYHRDHPTSWGLPLLLEITEDIEWVAHNAGFELGWLYASAKRTGIDWEPHAGFNCSLAAARLANRRSTALNLGALCRLTNGLGVDIKTLSTVNVERIAFEPLCDSEGGGVLLYNGYDAIGCYKVFDGVGGIDRDNYDQLIDTIASTTAMSLEGIEVEQAAAHRLHEEWSGRAAAAAAHAQTIYEVRQYCAARQVEFRLGSDIDIGNVLVNHSHLNLPKNNDGSWKTDDKTLTELAPDHPLSSDILSHRHARKMIGYIVPLIEAPTRMEDGKLHPTYGVALTRTLRLNSEDPNIQNFPKRKDEELREPIIPPPGCIFAAADFSSLEGRVYGMATRDRNLCRSIIDGVDIHYRWLDYILEQYPPYIDRLKQKVSHDGSFASIRKGGRDGIIKSDFVFASLYGASAASVSARADIPLDIVYDILRDFWKEYHSAYEWLKQQRREYQNTGSATDLFGRTRYAIFWETNSCINLPIQGTAARLVLDGQNELHQMSKREKDPHFLPRINIHDDLVFVLPDDDDAIRQYLTEIARVMVKVRNSWQTVPLAVDFRVGYNWADLNSCFKYTGEYHGRG